MQDWRKKEPIIKSITIRNFRLIFTQIILRVNNEQIFHAFLFDIRNYSPEVSGVEYCLTEVGQFQY